MTTETQKRDIFKALENDIYNLDLDEVQKNNVLRQIHKVKNIKVNLLITGATGCGKSSTINALFDAEIARVGVGVDPETMDIKKYELDDNLILWDTPGLGDSVEKDQKHACAIIDKLNEKDNNGDPLIDLILVILDGSSRDYKTSFELINKVLIPTIGEESKKRILVAINQADMAMKGKNWDYEKNKPEAKLVEFLEDKVKSVRNRIKDATGVDIEPIYYSAGYKEDGKEQLPYNLSKLLNFILNYTSEEKRLSYVNSISQNKKCGSIMSHILYMTTMMTMTNMTTMTIMK